MADTLNMTTGKPMKLLFSFALPLMFGNMFQQLYTVVDIAIVGQGVGMDALAALGCVDWLNWMLLGIAAGFTQGFGVRMSQKFGRQDTEGLKQTLGNSAMLTGIMALICTALAQLLLPTLLDLLQVPLGLREYATIYSRIVMGGFPAVAFFNFVSAVLRSVGDSKTPLTAMITAAVTNIALDLLTVYVFGWEVAGAAGATVFSQLLAGTICAIKIYKTPELHFSRRDLKLRKTMSLDLIGVGSPLAVKNLIIALGGIVVQAVVNGFQDVGFIAGFTATNKLYGILEIAALSYGYAVTTYVGQNYGAMRIDRIKSGIKAATVLSLISAGVIAVTMFLLGRPITMLFISQEDPAMALIAGDTAYTYLCTMSAALPMLYILYVFLSALQGMGNSMAALVSGIVELGLRLAVSAVVAYTGYRSGIFTAEVAAWTGSAIFLVISYLVSMKKITKKDPLS